MVGWPLRGLTGSQPTKLRVTCKPQMAGVPRAQILVDTLCRSCRCAFELDPGRDGRCRSCRGHTGRVLSGKRQRPSPDRGGQHGLHRRPVHGHAPVGLDRRRRSHAKRRGRGEPDHRRAAAVEPERHRRAVYALKAVGSNMYIGGSFTTVGGAGRKERRQGQQLKRCARHRVRQLPRPNKAVRG